MKTQKQAHVGAVNCLAFTADGSRIVSGGDDAAVKIWHATLLTELFSLHEHEDPVHSVACSLDGSRIISAGDDAVKIWESRRPRAEDSPARGATSD